MLPLKSVKHSVDAVVLEATADQDGTAKVEDVAIVTFCLGPQSYATACASLSLLFTECGLEREFWEKIF